MAIHMEEGKSYETAADAPRMSVVLRYGGRTCEALHRNAAVNWVDPYALD